MRVLDRNNRTPDPLASAELRQTKENQTEQKGDPESLLNDLRVNAERFRRLEEKGSLHPEHEILRQDLETTIRELEALLSL